MRSAAFICCLIPVLAWIQPAPAFGLQARAVGADEQLTNAFLPAPRMLRQHLARAEQAIAAGRYSDAVLELGAILTREPRPGDPPQQDYFLPSAKGPGVQTSLRGEAERILGSMPARGRELYELQFGGDARALLNQAVAAADQDQLAEVSRRFFHTKAGYEATLLLGRAELDHGRSLAAALCFQRVADAPGAPSTFDPELSILLATCWLYADMPQQAQQTLVELRRRQPQLTMQIGTRQTPIFQNDDQALNWLEDILGQHAAIRPAVADQWAVVGGNAARNAQAPGGLPLIRHRWRIPTVNDPMDERTVRQMHKQYLSESVAALPAVQPLAVDDAVLIRSPDRLLAVDLQTGKRIWEFPWFESSLERTLPSQYAQPPGDADSVRELQLNQRLWEDAAYGQLSSDGRSVFFIDELGYAGSLGTTVEVVAQGLLRQSPGAPRTHNRLVAVELATQGKLRWLVGGEAGEDEPALAGAFFLGPPLPLLGKLYVLAELNGEIRLVVLDAASGQVQWWQQLAHVDTLTIEHDQQRRLAGATPSFANGILVCPTSSGAVVGVDIITRSLRWGYQYKQLQPYRSRFGFHSSYRHQAQQSGQRWTDAVVTLAEGRVLLTPVESDELYCLDLLSGKLLWERQRENLLYVACVHQGKAVLVGAGRVVALRLADGAAAWSQPVDLEGSLPSGRGFYRGSHYFLPTSAAELVKIDLEQGEIVERVKTDQALGNLICYQDQLLSLGVEWLASYYQLEPLRERVARRLSQNPEDAWALTRQGELWLQEGKRREALVSLRQAHQLQPEDNTTRTLLVQTLLEALREDFAANRAIAEEVEQLIDQPDQYLEYLRLMGLGLRERGQTEQAFEVFLKLVDQHARHQPGIDPGDSRMEQAEPQLHIRADRWIQSQIAQLLEAAPADVRSRMDEAIALRVAEAVRLDSTRALSQLIAFFGAHPAADEARLMLAQRLVQSREFLEAELILSQVKAADDHRQQGRATAQMAFLLQEAEHYGEAAALLQQLAEQWPDVVCHQGQTGRQLLAQAQHDEILSLYLKQAQPWPYGQVEVNSSETSSNYARPLFRIDLQQRDGWVADGTLVLFDQSRTQLIVRDGQGRTWVDVPLHRDDGPRMANQRLARARLQGHLLLLSTGFEVMAIDTLQSSYDGEAADQILWRTDAVSALYTPNRMGLHAASIDNPWSESVQVPVDRDGHVLGRIGPVSASGAFLLKSRQLMCVNPLSGEAIWVRDGIDPGSALFGDEELLFAVSPKTHLAQVFAARDGRLLGQRQLEPEVQRWTTLGRRVLAWQQDQQQRLTLRLYDAWEEKEVWKRQFAAGSKGRLIEQEEVAVLQPDGQLLILSLRDAQPLVEAKVRPDEKLDALHVLSSADRYVVAASHPNVGPEEATIPGADYPLINGYLYAFDRHDGKSLWKEPAAVQQFRLPLDQPAELPVVFLLRQVRTRANNRIEARTSLLCLDQRDGRQLLQSDERRSQSVTYQITADHQEQTISLEVAGRTYVLHFTDKPLPAAAPAEENKQAAADAPPDRVRQLTSRVLNVLESIEAQPSASDQGRAAERNE